MGQLVIGAVTPSEGASARSKFYSQQLGPGDQLLTLRLGPFRRATESRRTPFPHTIGRNQFSARSEIRIEATGERKADWLFVGHNGVLAE
jgi:hypothetical protein